MLSVVSEIQQVTGQVRWLPLSLQVVLIYRHIEFKFKRLQVQGKGSSKNTDNDEYWRDLVFGGGRGQWANNSQVKLGDVQELIAEADVDGVEAEKAVKKANPQQTRYGDPYL